MNDDNDWEPPRRREPESGIGRAILNGLGNGLGFAAGIALVGLAGVGGVSLWFGIPFGAALALCAVVIIGVILVASFLNGGM